MNRGSVHRVFDTGIRRNWKPEDKINQQQLETALEIVIDLEEFSQPELVEAIGEHYPDLKPGSWACIASASLLAFYQSGLVVVKQDNRPTIWRIV